MALATAPARTRLPVAVYGVIAAAWLVAITAEATGQNRLLHHDSLVEGGLPLPFALLLFLAVWQVMIVAMMLPSTLPMFRLFRTAASADERPAAAQLAFLAGYACVWSVFGAVALILDVGVHRAVDAASWLAARPSLVPGSLFVMAGLAQFLPLTQACLRSCRHPFAYILQHYEPGVGAGFRLGNSHGLYCLGCCWALMLVMFATGVASVIWMAVLTTVMTYEKAAAQGERLSEIVGVALGIVGVIILVDPGWFPFTLA